MSEAARPIQLRAIETFVRIAETGSFSAAARSLGLSQSTVSAHVRALERAFGVSLFERRGRGVRSTAAGERLLAHARRVLENLEGAVAAVRAGGGLVGDLRIGASSVPGATFVPPAVARFLDRHPDVFVRLRLGDSQEVLDWVRRGDVDVGFCGVAPDPLAFDARPVARDRLLLLVARDDPLAGRRVAVSALRGRRFVLREEGSGTRRAALEALARLDPALVAGMRRAVEAAGNDAVRALLRAGAGIGLLSENVVVDDLERGRLQPVAVRGLRLTRRFHLVVRKGRPPPAPAARFVEEFGSFRR